jgi:hypothetical protein
MRDDNRPGRTAPWREPLWQFLLIGAGLFLLHRLVDDGETGAPREIVITEARVAALGENFAKTWLRPPTPEELKGLIDDYVREEVLYREAIAMGLDRDDTVVRRRLRQKMEFLAEDLGGLAEPGDAELRAFLDTRRQEFVEPALVSLEQVYFSTEKRGEAARREAEQALDALQSGRAGVSRDSVGDASLLPGTLERASPSDLSSVFGEGFAEQVDQAPLGQWAGPFESTYGLHLVRVASRTPGAMPSLEQIRPLVLREWQSEQSRRRSDELFRSMLEKYDVRIELDDAGAAK